MKARRSVWNIMALSLCGLLPAAAVLAKSTLDAIQLENIPLDSSLECSRTFFKSSRAFNGTIYVMPKVVPELREQEHPAFEIESDGKGNYNLSIGLYFPRNEELVRGEWDTDHSKNSRCNFDIVKDELNRRVKDPALMVERIAPMPLTSIEVTVPGVSRTGRIGRSLQVDDEVDILDYDGKSLPIEIRLSAEEKDEVVRRLDRAEGIPVKVRFRFQARSRDGAVTARIDWRQLSSGLSATLSGKNWISRLEFEAAVKSNLRRMSETVEIDAGRSSSFDKIALMVIDKITTEALALGKSDGAKPAEKNKAQKTKEKPAGSQLLNVKAVLEATSAQGSSEIRVEQNTAPETATAETIVRFRPKLKDPELHEIRVRAGFANPTFDEPIFAGQTIRITPAYHFLAKYSFANTRRTYLTEAQLRELHLDERFAHIAGDQMVIKNMKFGPGLAAVGRWISLGGLSPVYTPTRYLWRRTEVMREIVPQFSKALTPGLETLKRLPIDLAFSKLGGRSAARLGDVLGDHPHWSASLEDNGTIVLTAKQDLGLLTFVERFEKDQSALVPGEKDLIIKDLIMIRSFEEQRSLTQTVATSAPVVLRRDPITIVQSRYVVFYVSHPGGAGVGPAKSFF